MLASLLIITFLIIALFHLYWGITGPNPNSVTLPQIKGVAAFIPSRLAGFGVALAFIIGAALIAMFVGAVDTPVSKQHLRWLLLFMSLIFLLRSIGDFRLVGFFKRIKSSPFARLDTLFFSPLCFCMALGLFIVAENI
ncbi:DUF3995 domain-containing protein [bacterium]|nr:DUF3995 domain-containing protein [bacterium]